MTNVETIVVGMGEMQVRRGPSFVLACLGLGSCVALYAYDRITGIGGMAHIVLPSCDGKSGGPSPKYADTAVPMLIREMCRNGAMAGNIIFKMAGGARIFLSPGYNDIFKIGERNVESASRAIAREGISLAAADTGGSSGRSVRAYLDSGKIIVSCAGKPNKEL